MKVALVTLRVPPFDYRSPWWWCMDRLPLRNLHVELIGPSGEHHFQRQEFEHGTASLLNIYAEGEESWNERERVEFAVKSYVFLSKMNRSVPFERIVVSDADGAEPLITSILSALAPVWVQAPSGYPSRRGGLGRELMSCSERIYRPEEFVDEPDRLDQWTPHEASWTEVFLTLFDRS